MRVHSQSILNSLFILDLDLLLHCQERLSKNQFDLTVRKDERFLLDLHLTVSQFHCLSVPDGTLGKAAKRLNLLDCKQRQKQES